jgi:hypothetical protein
MQTNQNIPNSNETKESKEFQPCAGKDCINVGINQLKIIYINKLGWFCDTCKLDLLNLKLVDEVIGNETFHKNK